MLRSAAALMSRQFDYVIVGGGTAAGYACRELAAQGSTVGKVAVVTAEPVAPYERPALTKAYLHPPTAKVRARLPGFHTCVGGGGERQTPEWYAEKGISFIQGKATSLDLESKAVSVGEEKIQFGKLILATGCRPVRLGAFGVKGDDLANVCYLREDKDAAELVATLEKGKTKAVVVGGGYLGLECAAALLGWGDITLAIAIEATDHLILWDLPNHVPVGPVPVSGVTPVSLPLKELNPASTSVKHFVDIVWDVDSHAINVDNLKAVLRDKAWDELLEPLTLKERPTFRYISQFFLVPQVDGKICVVKHFYVLDDKIKGNCVAKLVRGQGHEVAWGANNKVKTRKALQWMLEHLAGMQFRHFALSTEKKRPVATRASANEEEQDGWRDRANLQQLWWIHRNIHREGSPINGWSEKLVQRALDSLANGGCLATLSTRYDITIDAVEPLVLEVIETIVPYLRDRSLWLLGEPGKGKTPLGRIIAMMFSRYHGGAGTFRSASDFDFFRGVHFDNSIPALYDDGEIGSEPIKKKKAFSDIFLMVILDNQYDPSAEPEDTLVDNIPHATFMKMVRPAIGFIAEADAMAILKRAVFIVFSKSHIYYHTPSAQPVPVKRMTWLQKDILTDACKPTFSNFKRDGPIPLDMDDRALWESEWLKEAFRKFDLVEMLESETPMLDALCELMELCLRLRFQLHQLRLLRRASSRSFHQGCSVASSGDCGSLPLRFLIPHPLAGLSRMKTRPSRRRTRPSCQKLAKPPTMMCMVEPRTASSKTSAWLSLCAIVGSWFHASAMALCPCPLGTTS
ncbi:unnamed protein product [Effrenium voratum]|nr:unnamed protein product [Effrenium voratum]